MISGTAEGYRAAAEVVDDDEETMTKQTWLWKAKLAQEANRYEDMVVYMRQVAETSAPLSDEENNMLATAYKQVLDAKRSARRTLLTVEKLASVAPWEATLARRYREQVDRELLALCADMVSVVDGWLASTRSQQSTTDGLASTVFFLKLFADYKRYAAEATRDAGERAAVVAESRVAYERADLLSRDALRPIHPVRLGLMLNYSVFLYQACHQRRQGHDLAKCAFDAAVAEIDSIDDHTNDESTLILRLIRDNLTIWVQENGGRSFEDPDAAPSTATTDVATPSAAIAIAPHHAFE